MTVEQNSIHLFESHNSPLFLADMIKRMISISNQHRHFICTHASGPFVKFSRPIVCIHVIYALLMLCIIKCVRMYFVVYRSHSNVIKTNDTYAVSTKRMAQPNETDKTISKIYIVLSRHNTNIHFNFVFTRMAFVITTL